jgi:hypothetical protein
MVQCDALTKEKGLRCKRSATKGSSKCSSHSKQKAKATSTKPKAKATSTKPKAKAVKGSNKKVDTSAKILFKTKDDIQSYLPEWDGESNISVMVNWNVKDKRSYTSFETNGEPVFLNNKGNNLLNKLDADLTKELKKAANKDMKDESGLRNILALN